MSEFKIGDRVEVISDINENGISVGCRGTIVDIEVRDVTVDFDNYISSCWVVERGRDGHCLRIPFEYLKKVEETEKEPKINAMERKILEALREEIGVDIGEEFYVYEPGVKWWTCKFEENGHLARYKKCKFSESFIWKYWIFHFDKYVFKRKPFMPRYSQEYFYLYTDYLRNEYMPIDAESRRWLDGVFDHGMLALGNVFRTKEEALENKDKLLERLNELLKEE